MVAFVEGPGGGRRNHPHNLKSGLSPRRRRLVELMQTLNFGCIEGLAIRDADPVLDPAPVVVQEIKFGGENGPRRERDTADFELKAQVVELFAHLDRLGDGRIDSLEIKHGLPFRMVLREATA